MAYIKNTWVDQNVEKPKTYNVIQNADSSITLVDNFGQITELGTPVNADNMNHIEDGVAGVAIRLHNMTEIFALDEWVKDGEKLYKSLQDQNQGHATSEAEFYQEVKFAGGQSAFSLFDHKFSDHIIKNLSWLLSTGQDNRKQDYPSMYEAIVKEQATPTITGVSIKLSTESFTDFDYVLNTTNETFRLPLKVKLAGGGKIPVAGNGTVLGMTDGTNKGSFHMGTSGGRETASLQYPCGYGHKIGEADEGFNYMTNSVGMGVTQDPTKSGLEADLSKATNDGLYLYFYVGDTIQNADIVDVADIKATKADINLGNVDPNIDIIIKHKINEDGSYFKKYKSGAIEQGGFSQGDNWKVITLLQPYKNNKYTILVSNVSDTDSEKAIASVGISNKTTTQFRARAIFTGNIGGFYWQAYGQGV